MDSMKPTLLILAAGMGSRYGGDKQVDGFGPHNETILEYSIFDAIQAGFGKVVFIVREEILELAKSLFVEKLSGKVEVDFVVQSLSSYLPEEYHNPERKKPYGTAHALLCAKDAVKEPFAVINADDFYGRDAFLVLGRFLSQSARPDLHCMVGYAVQNVLSSYGTVSRGVCDYGLDGNLKGMVERTAISRRESGAIVHEAAGEYVVIPEGTPVSMNCWGFHPSVFAETQRLWNVFLATKGMELKSEFYIPTVVNTLIEEKKAAVKLLEGGKTWFGVTYAEDRPIVTSALKELHESGIYPEKLF
jgi:UTP-glucose-1-phosphate uridylyltransferase